MKTKMVPIEKLIEYARNPRKNDHAVDAIASAIKEFGFRVPVIAKSDGTVVDGHLRLKAARKLGLKEVPVVLADDMTDVQIKAFRISVNRMAELAEWDDELLKLELDELKDLDFDLSLTGLDGDFISELAPTEREGLTDPDDAPEVNDKEPARTKRGEVWILGDHRLMCGDSTSAEDVEKLMNGEKADMVFTDPPYGVSFQSNMTKRFDVIKNDDKILEISDLIFENMNTNSAAFIWTSHHVYPLWREQFKSFYKQTLIWSKGGGGMGDLQGQYALNYEICLFCTKGNPRFQRERGMAVWKISKDAASDYIHPTQKPVELAENAIQDFSKSHNKILDLFGGSGSTLIACEKTSRKCRMMELDEHYCDVIIKRFEQFSGTKAIREADGKLFGDLMIEQPSIS